MPLNLLKLEDSSSTWTSLTLRAARGIRTALVSKALSLLVLVLEEEEEEEELEVERPNGEGDRGVVVVVVAVTVAVLLLLVVIGVADISGTECEGGREGGCCFESNRFLNPLIRFKRVMLRGKLSI
jgi:hypothetical protein